MKTLYNFLKTTFLGGIFFLIPLILIILVMEKGFRFVAKIAKPLTKALPFPSVAGIETSYLVAILVLIAVGFFAGILAKTGLGGHLRKSMEGVLDKIPGYALLRVFAKDAEPGEGVSHSPVGLLDGGKGNWQWCFIIERHSDGYLTIFIPGAPKPTSGSVRLIPSDQVKVVDVPMSSAIKCLTKSGAGSWDLVKDQIGAPPPRDPN